MGEEYAAINSERLVKIISESMQMFWEFVRADKDYGNVIKASHKTGIDLKDQSISDLLGNVRTQLQKVFFSFLKDLHFHYVNLTLLDDYN